MYVDFALSFDMARMSYVGASFDWTPMPTALRIGALLLTAVGIHVNITREFHCSATYPFHTRVPTRFRPTPGSGVLRLDTYSSHTRCSSLHA